MNIDKKFLKQAIKQAKVSMQKGGFPAGAVLVKNGKVISKGISLGGALNDPTEHSETSCIKKACKKLKTTNLEGCILYASLQPCLMCFSVANWAGILKIVYGCRKTEEMAKDGCYEGINELAVINERNNRQIELEFVSGFEDGTISMIREWKNSLL